MADQMQLSEQKRRWHAAICGADNVACSGMEDGERAKTSRVSVREAGLVLSEGCSPLGKDPILWTSASSCRCADDA